jgi:hypothetical protein
MSDTLTQLRAIIAAKKQVDPAGYRQAEARGELLSYLRDDLKRAKIDPSALNQLNRTNRTNNQVGAFDEVVETVSFHLDEVLYLPYYESNLASNHLGLADVMTKFRTCRNNRPLKNLKVAAAVSSILCVGLALSSTLKGRILFAGLYGVCAADLLRISYHCYDKKYCSLYLESTGGSAANLADSMFKFAKTAMGLAPPQEDPFVRFQTEIVWENLVQGSLCMQLVSKVSYRRGGGVQLL